MVYRRNGILGCVIIALRATTKTAFAVHENAHYVGCTKKREGRTFSCLFVSCVGRFSRRVVSGGEAARQMHRDSWSRASAIQYPITDLTDARRIC